MPEGTENRTKKDPIEIIATANSISRHLVDIKFVIEFVNGQPRLKLFESPTPSSEKCDPIFHFEMDSMGIGYLYGVLSSDWKTGNSRRTVPAYDSHGNSMEILVSDPNSQIGPAIQYTDPNGVTYEIKISYDTIRSLQIRLSDVIFSKTEILPQQEEGEPTNG